MWDDPICQSNLRKENVDLFTKRCRSESVIVIDKLSPCDDHDGTGVVMEAFVRVHSTRNYSGERQGVSCDADTWCGHSVGVEWSYQPNKTIFSIKYLIVY